jgi:hypothetical protein
MRPKKMSLRRKLCWLFMDIAEKIDPDYYMDVCFDLALDTGEVGMCSDCDGSSIRNEGWD